MSKAFDGQPVVPRSGRLTPGFWGQRQQVNSSATIEHCHDRMERLDWVGNFRAANEDRLPPGQERCR